MNQRLAPTLLVLTLTACDSGSSSEPDADTATDAPIDAEDAVAEVDAADVPSDGSADTAADAPDADGSGSDADAADAEVDTPDFSDWDHMTAWVAADLDWPNCDTEPDGALAAKAAYFDWIVPAIHQVPRDVEGHEDWSRVFTVQCAGPVPTEIVGEESVPSCTHNLSENNGLWTSLYVASQAYRYAATGDADALDQVLRTLRGTHRMMRITGTPGLYTRDFRDPSIPQQHCPSNPMEYVPMGEDMVGNRWVRVGDDGCFVTYDPTLNEGSGDWVRDAEHCTSDEFAGFCWQRNVSKDEYSGHFYAAMTVAKLVDDPEAQELAATILRDAVQHLIDNEYWITDYDGRPTRYGSAHAMSLDHIPGFNALLALAWTRAGLSVTHDPTFADFYYGCLLQERDVEDCIDHAFETGADYRSYLTNFVLKLGCQTNFDNVNIAQLAYTGLMLMEPDPALRATYRTAFQTHSRGPDVDGRDIWSQGNPHWNFTIAALMGEDPESADDALSLVGDGVCRLYEFRGDNIRRAVDNSEVPVECVSERHGSLAAEPLPMAQRCSSVFEWWGDPAEIGNCGEDLTAAQPPAAYLLPYWMGRYYGFISAEM